MTEELNGKVNQTLDAVGQLIGIVQELVSVTARDSRNEF